MTPEDLDQKSFDQWLADQHAGRELNYAEPMGCLIASWAKDTGLCENPSCGPHYIRDATNDFKFDFKLGSTPCAITFPRWLQEISNLACELPSVFTVKDFRKVYCEK